MRLLRFADGRAAIFLSPGFALIGVGDWSRPECRIEDGCFAEGGPSFQEGTVGTVMLGAGVHVSPHRTVAMKFDVMYFGEGKGTVVGLGAAWVW